MRYIKYAFYAILAICLVSIAVANRTVVTLHLLTDDIAGLLGIQATIDLPLYLIVFGGIAAGLLIGFVWEWFREHKHRAEAAREKREKAQLAREVDRLRDTKAKPEDDVLALLENGKPAN
ncbi:LapA family protein [Pseudoruegeria sp. SHC-113]|uniref:LapA family protein n=1 Tax=Pseudoruegeria sp. SHC-113 TaxID=2855439 RepID=UPI0021BAA1A4|nr:LapA family protein [Pseudoruegeria sp. SHC-113]MCT8161856.1 LapA family protein [Pseudoruegeria sp. SHC-113]